MQTLEVMGVISRTLQMWLHKAIYSLVCTFLYMAEGYRTTTQISELHLNSGSSAYTSPHTERVGER